MGFVPYILFLHALRRRRAAPLLVLELPNCSRSHYQDVIPSVPSFRAALETLLRREFGVTRSGESRPPLGRCLHRALFTPEELAVNRRVRAARPLSRHRLLLDGDE